MALGWNGYDEQSNPENKVIGSKVTAYIDADLYVRWMLSKAFDLNAGISLSHFSNGNTTYPNMGLNTGGIRLGLAYYINRQPLTVPKVEREKLPDSRGFYTDGFISLVLRLVWVFRLVANLPCLISVSTSVQVPICLAIATISELCMKCLP